jgi:hypothetical protein
VALTRRQPEEHAAGNKSRTVGNCPVIWWQDNGASTKRGYGPNSAANLVADQVWAMQRLKGNQERASPFHVTSGPASFPS